MSRTIENKRGVVSASNHRDAGFGVGQLNVGVDSRFDEADLLNPNRVEENKALHEKINNLHIADKEIWGRVLFDKSKGKVAVLTVVAGALAAAGVVGIGTLIKKQRHEK